MTKNYLKNIYKKLHEVKSIITKLDMKWKPSFTKRVEKSNENHTIAIAQGKLGKMYFKGAGVIRDYKETLKWWNISVSNGVGQARNHRSDQEDNDPRPNCRSSETSKRTDGRAWEGMIILWAKNGPLVSK